MPLQNIATGDFGVVKGSRDNVWYRSRLIMREGCDQIKIVLIDLGYIEVKFMNEFLSLHKLFTELPAQAIGCSLSEVSEHKKIF